MPTNTTELKRTSQVQAGGMQAAPHARWAKLLASDYLPLLTACACVIFATALIVHTYSVFSQTFDEPAHLACGMQWLDRGTYDYEALHPPLARVAAALLPYLSGERSLGLDWFWYEGNFLLDHGGHYQRTLTLARLGILPFFWLTCFLAWRYMARAFGHWQAALAVFFIAFCPVVLAHSGIAATDAPLMAMFLAALIAWQKLLENPGRLTAIIAGMLIALATLTKFTAMAFLACSGAILLLHCWTTKKRLPVSMKHVLLAVAVFALTIWAGYRFSHGPIIAPKLLTPQQQEGFATYAPWQKDILLFPYVPANEFFRGLKDARHHGANGREDSYLLGHVYDGGRWYFFPIAILVKTPIPLLLLSLGGIVAMLFSRSARGDPGHMFLLAGVAGPLLVGMAGSMNIGLRHILPIYPFLAMWAGLIAVQLWRFRALQENSVLPEHESEPVTDGGAAFPVQPESSTASQNSVTRDWRSTAARIVLILLLAWSVITCVRATPDFLAYFNEPAAPHASDIIVESDVDWGQDLNRLNTALMQRHVGVLWIEYYGFADLKKRLTPSSGAAPQLHELKAGDRPLGWVAISEAKLRKYPASFGWLVRYPYERVGKSIRLYHFTTAP